MAAVSSIVAGVALAVAAGATYEQRQQAKSAAKERKEQAAIGSAEQSAQQMSQRRQQLREERIRRAQILQSSENTGVSASSGQLGAIDALGSSTAGNMAAVSRQANTAAGITLHAQNEANANLRGQEAAAIGGIASTVFGTALNTRLAQGPSSPQTPSGGQSPLEVENPYNNIFGTRR